MASHANAAKDANSTRTSAPKNGWREANPIALQGIEPAKAANVIKRLRMLQQAFHDYQQAIQGIPQLSSGVVDIAGQSPGIALVLSVASRCKTCRNFSLGPDCQHCQHDEPVPSNPTEPVLATEAA